MMNLSIGSVTAELKANPKPLIDSLKQIETESVRIATQLETQYASVFKRIENTVQSSQSKIETSARAHNNRLKSLVDSYTEKYKVSFQKMAAGSKESLDKSSKELKELTADIKTATNELKELVAEFKNVGKASGNVGSKRGSTTRMGMEGPKPDTAPLYEEMWNLPYRMEHIGRAMYFSLSRPLQYAFGEMKNMVVAFEHSLLSTQAILGKTGAEFEKFKDLAVSIATDGYGKIAEAAQVMEVLAKAGVNDTAIEASTSKLVDLGLAMDMDARSAASMALQISSAFNKSITEIDYYADVLAKGTNSANMNLSDLLNGLSYVAPIASAANTSLEETTALMGLLANSGIKGTKAGTALRNMFARLLNPSNDMAKTLDKYNISLTDTEGNFRSLIDIFKDFQTEQVSLTEVMKTFVQRAGPGVAKIITSDIDALEEAIENLYNAHGELDSLIATKMSGVEGAMRKIESAKERIGKALFEKIFAAQLKEAANWADKLAFSMENLSDESVKTIGYMLELGVAFGKLLLALGISKRASKLLQDMTKDMKGFSKIMLGIGPKTAAVFAKIKSGVTTSSIALGKFATGAGGMAIAMSAMWAALLALGYKVNPKLKSSLDDLGDTTKKVSSDTFEGIGGMLGKMAQGTASALGWAKNEANIYGQAYILWLEQLNAERAAKEESANEESQSRWSQFADYVSEKMADMSIDTQGGFDNLVDQILSSTDSLVSGWDKAMVGMDNATGGMLTNAQNNLNTFFNNTMGTLSDLWNTISLFDQRQQIIQKQTTEEIEQATMFSPPEEPQRFGWGLLGKPTSRTMPRDFSMPIIPELSPEAESFQAEVAPFVGMSSAEKARLDVLTKYAQLKKEFYNVQDQGMLDVLEEWKKLEIKSIDEMEKTAEGGGGSGGGGTVGKAAKQAADKSAELYQKIFELTHTDTEIKQAQLKQQYDDYVEHTGDMQAATEWFLLASQKLNKEYLEDYSASVAKGITKTLELYLQASEARIDQYYDGQLQWIDELEAASKELYESQVKAEEELHALNMKRIDDHYNGLIDNIELQRKLQEELAEEEEHYASIRDKVRDIHLAQAQVQTAKDNAAWEQTKLQYNMEGEIYDVLLREQEALDNLVSSRDNELARLEEKRLLLEENYALSKEESELAKLRSYEDLAGVDNGSYLMQEYERFMRGTNLQFDTDASAFSASSIYDSIDNFLSRRASAFGMEVTDDLRQSLFDQFLGMTKDSPELEYQKQLVELQQKQNDLLDTFEMDKARILTESLVAQNDIKQGVMRQAQLLDTQSAVEIAEKMNDLQDTEGEFDELNAIVKKYLDDRKIDKLIESLRAEYDTASEEERERSRGQLERLGVDDEIISAAYGSQRTSIGAQREVEKEGIEANATKIITDLPTEDLKAFLTEFMPEWETYGMTMGEKLMEGLESGLENDEALLSMIRDLAQKVLSEMKDALGISSPSKKAMQISEYYLQGLQRPMVKGSAAYGGLMDAVDGQARDVIERYQKQLSRPSIGSGLVNNLSQAMSRANAASQAGSSANQYDYRNQSQYHVTVHSHDDQVAIDLERTLRKATRVFA
jgi:TP901 family phage tail tape measure protein